MWSYRPWESLKPASLQSWTSSWARTRAQQIGRVVAEGLFELPTVGRQRRPDVAFVSYETWPRGRRIPQTEAWPVAPDLAVEVISPSNKEPDIFGKPDDYFAAGSRQVWMVLPRRERVYIYSSPTQVRILTRADELTGEPLLPGFRLPLSQLFEEETDPA